MPAPASRIPWRTAARILVVSAFLSLTVCFFAPSSVYFGNALDFAKTFGDVSPLLVAAALVSTLVVGILLVLLPAGRTRDVGTALIFALAVLAWIQSNFLLWNYGVLAGRPIDWAAHWRAGLVDAAVWTAVIAGAAVAFRAVNRVAVAASALLILVQGAGVAVQVERSPDRWYNHVDFDDSARFALSSQTNVVVVLLDTFQSDLFQELLDEDPALTGRFRGFTYFRNATSGFPSTAASIAFILTGRQYDNSTPFLPFVKTAFQTASLPQALKAAGFDVYYHNPYYWPTVYADASISSHTIPRIGEPLDYDTKRLTKSLLRLGVFRSLPQAGKRLITGKAGTIAPAPATPASGGHGDADVSGDVAFFTMAAANLTAKAETPVFRYYHLWGIHPPLAYDEQLRPMSANYTRENAKRQAKGLLTLVDSFCRTLEERKLYDRTLLLILGDHGTSFIPRLVTVDSRTRTGSAVAPAPTGESFGLPLVLMKPRGASGPLQISDAPVSLGDVPRTVMASLQLPNTFPGVSMLDPGLPADRHRIVFKYNADTLRLMDLYFPDLTEFSVSGFSWLAESWERTGRVFSRGTIATGVVFGAYSWGARVRFKAGGNGEEYEAGGWSVPEKNLTWTKDRDASLLFRVSQPATDLRIRADILPYLSANATRQRVKLFVRDTQVGEWSVTARGVYTATVPKALVTGGTIALRFELPDAESPRSATGQVLDQRELGIAVFSLDIEEAGASTGR